MNQNEEISSNQYGEKVALDLDKMFSNSFKKPEVRHFTNEVNGYTPSWKTET